MLAAVQCEQAPFMQWSKLKARVKERICPELRSRIDFHLTSYRHSHDETEKVWSTIDGVRVATFSWYQKQWRSAERDEEGRLVRRHNCASSALPKGDPAWAETAKMRLPQDFGNAMRLYLDLKIQDALTSADPIIRAFALIDRRCGKRSLRTLHMRRDDDPLVRAFWHARLQSTGD